MKLHFEPDLDFQHAAIEAACDLFRGQETCRSEFTVIRDPADRQLRMSFAENDLGIGNRLHLLGVRSGQGPCRRGSCPRARREATRLWL